MITMTTWIAPKKGPGRPPKYPWDTWLDGKAKVLTRESDFTASTTSMRHMVLQTARARGIDVRTEVGADRYIRLIFPGQGVRGEHVWPTLPDEDLDGFALVDEFSIPRGGGQNLPRAAWREYLEHELGQRGRVLATDEVRDGSFRFTLLPLVPKQPYASEANLDKVFDMGRIEIPPERREPFSDQQWIDYFTEAFGVSRAGNPTFEVDPDTGVMKIEINPKPDDE